MCNVLKEMNPTTNQQHHISLGKVDGEGAIAHECVRNFIHTKTDNVKVDHGLAQKYLNDIDTGGLITDVMVDEEMGKVASYLSVILYIWGIQNSKSYHNNLAGVEMQKQYSKNTNKFMGGMKHITQVVKQHLGLILTEGKVPMPLKAYNNMARVCFFNGEKRIFSFKSSLFLISGL